MVAPAQNPGYRPPPLDCTQPYVDRKYTTSDFPEFDSSIDSYITWCSICRNLARHSPAFAQQMTRVLPDRFRGALADWWSTVPVADKLYFTTNWEDLHGYVLHFFLTPSFLDKVCDHFHACRYRKGERYYKESPHDFAMRKLRLLRVLYPLADAPGPDVLRGEAQRLLEDIPKGWWAHLNIDQLDTAEELLRLTKLKHDELVASDEFSIDALANCVARINLERNKCGGGHVETRSAATASGSHAYPMNDYKSRKKPPRPCRHCGSAYHWDNDCPPRKADRSKGDHKERDSSSRLEGTYRRAYTALVEGQEAEFAVAYTEFCTLSESESSDVPDIDSTEDSSFSYIAACAWSEVLWDEKLVGTAIAQGEIYEARKIFERPPGQQSLGSDACRVSCRVNAIDGLEIEALADSGAACTLISAELYDRIKGEGTRIKQGLKLNLVQLTGKAKCQGYTVIDLYLPSQRGHVLLRGVEAYVLKGMTIPLLIAEDVQMAFQLHTMRPPEREFWQVADSDHQVPLRSQLHHKPAYQMTVKPIHPWDSQGTTVSGTGRLKLSEDITLAP